MKSKGYEESTMIPTARRLKHLSIHTDLNNPENVVGFIIDKKTTNAYKNQLFIAYNKFLQFYEIDFELPFLKTKSKQIKIPTTTQLDTIIANSGYTLSRKLTISKETGLRPIELMSLKTKDIDLERRTIHPTTAKHGAPRTLKISQRLSHLLESYIIQRGLKPNSQLFKGTPKSYRETYAKTRDRTADKLNTPQLKTIRLYDFRHYFATMLYNKTKDILYVQRQMGHRRLESTLVYTQLIQFDQENNYICKVAKDTNDIAQLIESGFEYVTETNGLRFFRKRK